MKVMTTKSKNAESFYVTKSYINYEGKSTSTIIRKLGTLKELSQNLDADRDGVMAWAKEQARLETLKYKEQEEGCVLIPFHSNKQLEYGKRKRFRGGYLFPQYIYYSLKLDFVCRKIKSRHRFRYDLNAIFHEIGKMSATPGNMGIVAILIFVNCQRCEFIMFFKIQQLHILFFSKISSLLAAL